MIGTEQWIRSCTTSNPMEKSSLAGELLEENSRLPLASVRPRDRSRNSRTRDYWYFFSAFVRRPLVVGAIAPSSRRLAEAMIPPVDLKSAQTVVELGAGTGAVTQTLRQHIGHRTNLIALELHGGSARRLRQRFRDLHVISDTAENLRHHLDLLGHHSADCIISGLPWGSMSGDLQDRILDAVLASLKPGGTFSAMAYLHASGFSSSRKFKRKLERNFGHVASSPVVWANLPPAFVYYCS
jgi:phosphatidylethanolamine/phosphatidyl-N-methylethanolamine N-methyltransferase